jgi:DNA-directed RNA polymerase specialized sigma24 family protein
MDFWPDAILARHNGAIAITLPARYCYTVAKFVLLEDLRREHKQFRLDDRERSGDAAIRGGRRLESEESLETQEQRLECLERCLQELKPAQRALVIEYHRDARRQRIERRRDMAKRLRITMNALSIRVSRIRTALEASVKTCRKERR